MPASTLLPGIYFETGPERPRDVLPRMDVAAFVGFAAAGPVATPVAVEDLDRFREIFGADLPLAWDRDAGRLAYAHLGPTVETFFRNGGRRCWIVRVAAAPLTHRFELPGLVAAGDLSPAVAAARSPGSWADSLRAGTVLERERLPLPATGATPLAAAAGDYALDLAVSPPELPAGELLELHWRELGLRLLLFVATAAAEDEVTRVRATSGYWFETPGFDSPPFASPDTASPDTASPPLEDVALDESEGLALWGVSPSPPPAVHRLRFSLVVWQAGGPLAGAESRQLEARLGALAFHPDHPRFWGRLPSDDALFALPHGRHQPPQPPAVQALADEAAHPRFPLAAETAPEETYLPLAMATEVRPELAAAPLDPLDETALERDGLADFAAALFVDPDLTWASGTALLLEAEHKLYRRREPLAGLHCLLPVDEPSLVAVPDAAHPGWSRERPEIAPPLGAPSLLSVGEPVDGFFVVAWEAVGGATGYRLQQGTSPGFDAPREVARTAALAADVPLTDPCPRRLWFRVRAERDGELGPWSNTLTAILPPTPFLDCAEPLLPGFELAHHAASPGPGGWLDWQPDPQLAGNLAPAELEIESSSDPGFAAVAAVAVAAAPPFDLAAGGGLAYYRVRPRDGERVGPWSNTVVVLPAGPGDWSLLPAAVPAGELLDVQRALLRFCAARRDLLALLSAPAGHREDDLVEHLRLLEPGDFAAGVATAGTVRPLRLSEIETLDFGAFYHPWVTTFPEHRARAGTLALTSAPPEGTVTGSMAALAIRDGAWIAPANRPLDGIFALTPELDRAVRPALLERRVNLLVQEPRGFFACNTDTLAREQEVRPINVRRLLILLRRLALREGNAYVFEPNHEAFRGRVRHRFERVLSHLFVRGALAGANAEQAFRVVVDDSVNTPQTIDRGQFLVELRVAPSRPMKFLSIRLVQDGPERLSVQEI